MGTASNPVTTAANAPGLSITVEKNPPEARLLQLGVKSWPKWGCPPGKYPLKFDAALTCYLLKGRVRASVKGSRESVEFGGRRPRRPPSSATSLQQLEPRLSHGTSTTNFEPS
ncbi:hypothetical protein PR202_ga19723 [Eleusine coracana subsp. coracana]|uniref:(S)-ureidoglycine aminohydrolase cupin domain-containing protein n=1 Tax=Eleusine coracana subsp. coracana TaxID=191504 RepID=A0AAV5CVH8_ELECO|nr:hypothetical protein PR202_ga19723 [Eleusine coracana subsp. coracana]